MKIPLFIILLLSTMTFASANPPADLQAKLDELVKDGPGGAAAVWVDADGAAFFQSGTFSANDPRPITAETQFELGSVSKVFTALLLAESERLGKISRLDPAAKYLLPANDPAQPTLAKITLLSLTTHTSGLPRMPTNFGSAANPDPYASYDDAKLVAALRADGPGAIAGHTVAYSNFGAAILGESLAAAWGTSYAEALKAHVLDPLGLKATSVGLAGLPPPTDLAPGHAGGKLVPNWTFQAFAPAGALRSSPRDLAIFLAATLEKRSTPLRAAFDATLQPQYSTENQGHIGLAWFLFDDPQHPVAWHNGATAGSHTFVAFDRKAGVGVAILSNIQQAVEPLGFGLLGVKPPAPGGEKIKNAADYIGHYPLTAALAFNVIDVNGTLRVKLGEMPSVGLRTVAPDRFSVVEVVAEVSFERDATGKVTALVLHQNGINQRALRGHLPPLPKEVTLPVETLRDYVGKFPLSPAFVLTVTLEGSGLFAQATNQPKFELFALAKDEFFLKVAPAQISFQRDAPGQVTGLILHQNGRNLPAKKAAD